MTEHVLILLFTGSQDNQLNIVIAQFIHHILNQVKSFLVSKPGYHADHHLAVIYSQAQFILKSTFILYFFFAEITGIVVLRNQGICLRIKFLIIDSIDDSPQAVCTGTHQAV